MDNMLEVVYEILQSIARSLGFDYMTLRLEASADGCRYICVFGRYVWKSRYAWQSSSVVMYMYENGHIASIDKFTDDGKSKTLADVYREFARKLYWLLENGEAVYVEDKRLEASMVSEFMIGCVLNGVVQ